MYFSIFKNVNIKEKFCILKLCFYIIKYINILSYIIIIIFAVLMFKIKRNIIYNITQSDNFSFTALIGLEVTQKYNPSNFILNALNLFRKIYDLFYCQ